MAVPLLRTLILYCAVICAVRLMGKRQIGSWTRPSWSLPFWYPIWRLCPCRDLGIPLLSGLVPIATLVVLEIFPQLRRTQKPQIPAAAERSAGHHHSCRGQLDIGSLRQMRLTTDEVG